MTVFLLYGVTSVLLFVVGFGTVFSDAQPLRRLLALNVIGSGVFLFLVTVSVRPNNAVPDPVPHAMVLTGLVVSVSITALALVLITTLGSIAKSPSETDRNH